jgi:hypothetical protein
MRKLNFCFGLMATEYNITSHMSFYPPKMRCYVKKLPHMYHACRITAIFNGFFIFAKIFAKISIFGKIFAKFLLDFGKKNFKKTGIFA